MAFSGTWYGYCNAWMLPAADLRFLSARTRDLPVPHSSPERTPINFCGVLGFVFLSINLVIFYLSLFLPHKVFNELCHNHCNFSISRESLFLHSKSSRTIKSRVEALWQSRLWLLYSKLEKKKTLSQLVSELTITFNVDEIWQEQSGFKNISSTPLGKNNFFLSPFHFEDCGLNMSYK